MNKEPHGKYLTNSRNSLYSRFADLGAIESGGQSTRRNNWYANHGYVKVYDDNLGHMYIKTEDIPKLTEVKVEK